MRMVASVIGVLSGTNMVSQDHILKSINKYGPIGPYPESPMSRSPDGPDRFPGNIAGHGFLTPAIRRDVADVNRRFLDLALEPALAGDPRFSLPDDVVPVLSAGGDALLSRVAACPFTLFQVSLAHGRLGGLDRAPGVEDTRRPLLDAATVGRALSFAHVAVFL